MSNESRILIVDDDEHVLVGLERTLEDAGYRTVTAWSRQEALRLSDQVSFDLLLVGERLGGLDAAPLVTKLKQLQPNAAVLLMLARENPGGRVSGLTGEAVCKWKPDEVKARVRVCLAA